MCDRVLLSLSLSLTFSGLLADCYISPWAQGAAIVAQQAVEAPIPGAQPSGAPASLVWVQVHVCVCTLCSDLFMSCSTLCVCVCLYVCVHPRE